MGGGASRRKKEEVFVRRDPLATVDEVMSNKEALNRVKKSVQKVLPGTPSRWKNILQKVNVDIPPDEENLDPLRLNLDMDKVWAILKQCYETTTSLESDGLQHAREYMPIIYDKPTFERGMKLSEKERESRGLSDSCYAYGELDHEVFTTIFLKSTTVYGLKSKGIFYDLGCGCGALVYAAAFIGDFNRLVGVENVGTLLLRGENRQDRWERLKENFSDEIQQTAFQWIEDDFLSNSFWREASFILLHWTAFSLEQKQTLADLIEQCEEGTQVISFTSPIPGTSFQVLIEDTCITSWGTATFFFQEKITTAQAKPPSPGQKNQPRS